MEMLMLSGATELFIRLEFRSLINKLNLIKGVPEKIEESPVDKFERNRQQKKYILIK